MKSTISLYAGIASLFAIALVLGYPAAPNSRIVNGDVGSGPISYLVSVQVDDFHICAGFIYSHRWVVTAASCVTDTLVSSLKVSINDYSFINATESFERKVSVYQLVINEGYNATTQVNDIALLELSETLELIPIAENEASYAPLGPSCLRYDEYSSSYYFVGVISGWGLTEVNGPSVQYLRRGNVIITDSSDCADVTHFTPTTMICTLSNKAASSNSSALTAPCTYDEGMPLVVYDLATAQKAIIGIFSYNNECNVELPSIFTRLSVYYGWLSRIAGYQPPECYYS